ncbi:MAG: RsmD family RNA methyltransferase [Bacteroidales bacterium]|nr:RsmD family RNA methyltransferase [Bacteroidales bacterium]
MKLLTPETVQFIKEHLNDDVAALALHHKKNPCIDFEEAFTQISGFQKAKNKLPLLASNSNIRYPKTLSLEQCSSETTANFKAGIFKGSTLLDLTGGFGIDSIAFSKQFDKIFYVEKDPELCGIMEYNCTQLGINNINIINDEAETAILRAPNVDVIYLDPSRRTDKNEKVFRLEHCSPNILTLMPLLKEKASMGILCKLSPIADIKSTCSLLPSVTSLWIVSAKNECKELLCAIDLKTHHPTEPTIEAIDINNDKLTRFTFTFSEEAYAKPIYADCVMKYLYEPLTPLLKAGAFKLLSERFKLQKLHQHTHLYTSDILQPDFPGNIFKTEAVLSFNKKELKKHLPALNGCCLKVRNFPMSVDSLSKQLCFNARGEGDRCLFATTLSDEKHLLILGTRQKIS